MEKLLPYLHEMLRVIASFSEERPEILLGLLSLVFAVTFFSWNRNPHASRRRR